MVISVKDPYSSSGGEHQATGVGEVIPQEGSIEAPSGGSEPRDGDTWGICAAGVAQVGWQEGPCTPSTPRGMALDRIFMRGAK